MTSFEKFLEPVSETDPCGEDVSYSPVFLELENLLRGKSETQFSEGEEPDWKAIRARCEDLLARSKHLYPATVLCLAVLQTEGVAGCASALGFLSRLLERYWNDIHPKLDPSDALDPLERMNILASLTAPLGSFGDTFRFIERLSAAPLANSPRFGRPGLTDSADTSAATQWEAAFRDTPSEDIEAGLAAAMLGSSAVASMSEFLSGVQGGEKAPSFDLLADTFTQMEKVLRPFASVSSVEDGAAEAGNVLSAAPAASGTIQNRHDVVAAIDRICAFYEAAEPSSPVPLLLKRACRLVHSDFLGIMADLAPDSVAQLRHITGAQES